MRGVLCEFVFWERAGVWYGDAFCWILLSIRIYLGLWIAGCYGVVCCARCRVVLSDARFFGCFVHVRFAIAAGSFLMVFVWVVCLGGGSYVGSMYSRIECVCRRVQRVAFASGFSLGCGSVIGGKRGCAALLCLVLALRWHSVLVQCWCFV